jgi:drug/metabolite transporter (DMT)-like permease
VTQFQLGTILGLVSAATFVVFGLWSREVQHREGPWRYMVYISVGPMLAGAAAWLVVPGLRPEFSWTLWRGVAMAAAPAMTGMFFMGLAVRHADVSHVGPVMGSKALVITVLAVVFGFEPVAPRLWAASGILLVALFLVSGNREVIRRPWRIVDRGLVLGMLMCVFASLADLISRRQMADHDLRFWDFLSAGWMVRGSLCLTVLLVACGVRRLPILPRRASTFSVTALVVMAHGVIIVAAFRLTDSAVLTNVLTSLRGVLSVVAVILLARWNIGRRERLTRGIVAARVVGSLLICGAVYLALVGFGAPNVEPAAPGESAAAPAATGGGAASADLGPRPTGGARTAAPQRPAALDDLYARCADALQRGRPVVATVHVLLCDNAHQGIAPVRAELGDGDAPRSNLYWGAMYGVRALLDRAAEWKLLAERPAEGDILAEAVFSHRADAGAAAWRADGVSGPVEVILVARAWRGRAMKACLGAFAADLLGDEARPVGLPDGRAVAAGAASHVVGFVGHNALMDLMAEPAGEWPFADPRIADGPIPARGRRRVKGWFALACKSDAWFAPLCARAHAARLLATRQLMAPEAYTLAALLKGLARRADGAALRSAAAGAYARYQKVSLRAALGVFAE